MAVSDGGPPSFSGNSHGHRRRDGLGCERQHGLRGRIQQPRDADRGQRSGDRAHSQAYRQWQPQALELPEVEVQGHSQRHGGRTQQEVHELGAFEIGGVGRAGRHQQTDQREHCDQDRIQQRRPTRLAIQKIRQEVGADGERQVQQR